MTFGTSVFHSNIGSHKIFTFTLLFTWNSAEGMVCGKPKVIRETVS
jgi:hypothetical protein